MINLENIPKRIDEAYAESRKDDRKPHIGPSAIGHDCVRKIWYEARPTEKDPISGRILRLMDSGKDFEAVFIFWLQNVGYNAWGADETYQHPEIKSFYGTPDAFIFGENDSSLALCLVEFKTLNASMFSKLKKSPLQDSFPVYYAQCQAYMGLAGLQQCLFMALNKNDHTIHAEEVHFHEGAYRLIEDKARYISECETEPNRVASTPMFYQCKMCEYSNVCWDKKNDQKNNKLANRSS